MKLKILRNPSTANSTLGDLYVNRDWECHTLEDVVREVDGQPVATWKIENETAIPRGTYKVIIDFSNRFQRNLPHILNVPGFTGIRIHPGNTDKDTAGCILVGQEVINDDFIGGSRAAFAMLLPKLEKAINDGEEITIEVV